MDSLYDKAVRLLRPYGYDADEVAIETVVEWLGADAAHTTEFDSANAPATVASGPVTHSQSPKPNTNPYPSPRAPVAPPPSPDTAPASVSVKSVAPLVTPTPGSPPLTKGGLRRRGWGRCL